MPDLINIQGDATVMKNLYADPIPSLDIIVDTAKVFDSGESSVDAFADSATQATVTARNLTVTVITTEADYNADAEATFAALNDTLFDYDGNVS
jgi:hypothetical protein